MRDDLRGEEAPTCTYLEARNLSRSSSSVDASVGDVEDLCEALAVDGVLLVVGRLAHDSGPVAATCRGTEETTDTAAVLFMVCCRSALRTAAWMMKYWATSATTPAAISTSKVSMSMR